MARYRLVLEFSVPSATYRSDLGDYIKAALKGWGGAFSPEDRLFLGFEDISISGFQPIPEILPGRKHKRPTLGSLLLEQAEAKPVRKLLRR